MNDRREIVNGLAVMLVVFVIGGVCGAVVAALRTDDAWQKKAIAHGAAEYRVDNTGTVQWFWIDRKEKP